MGGAVAPGGLEPPHDLPGSVDLYPFIGQCWSGDGAAQLLQPLALVGIAAHGRVQAEALMVGTQILVARSVALPPTLHREHVLPGAWAKGNAVS